MNSYLLSDELADLGFKEKFLGCCVMYFDEKCIITDIDYIDNDESKGLRYNYQLKGEEIVTIDNEEEFLHSIKAIIRKDKIKRLLND